MEAVAAVSLAGNILQFIVFVASVVSNSAEIHSSASGTLREHRDQESITNDLKSLSSKIRDGGSAGSSGPLLQRLCTQCIEVAEELQAALDKHKIKGNHKRTETIRKSLKALWGKEKLLTLERRVASFRQELTLHVAVDLSERIEGLSSLRADAFQDFDQATRSGINQILDLCQKHRDDIWIAVNSQIKRMQKLHTDTRNHLTEGIELAAANLENQAQKNHAESAQDRNRTRLEVFDAITHAVASHDRSLIEESQNISAKVSEENRSTRVEIEVKLDANQQIMKQEIHSLQNGLQQLKLEIEKNTEELKELIVKINTTRESPKRQRLKNQGNTAHIYLMSLVELYKSLQELLKPLVKQAKAALGILISMPPSARARNNNDTATHLSDFSIDRSKFSISMYYAFYYQPLFNWPTSRGMKTEVVLLSKIKQWVEHLNFGPKGDDPDSAELDAIINLANSDDQFIWAMTILIASVNIWLPQSGSLVLRTAFNVRYDRSCILPADRSVDRLVQSPDISTSVHTFLCSGAPAWKLNNPRYGVDSIIGQRLTEDITLLTELARRSGLHQSFSEQRSRHRDDEDQDSRVDCTLALIGLLSQSPPWKIRFCPSNTTGWHWPNSVLSFEKCLYVQAGAHAVISLFKRMQSAGINMDMMYVEEYNKHDCSSNIFNNRKRDRKAWLERRIRDSGRSLPSSELSKGYVSGKHEPPELALSEMSDGDLTGKYELLELASSEMANEVQCGARELP